MKFQNRKVVLIANVKPGKLRDVVSAGLVNSLVQLLCGIPFVRVWIVSFEFKLDSCLFRYFVHQMQITLWLNHSYHLLQL